MSTHVVQNKSSTNTHLCHHSKYYHQWCHLLSTIKQLINEYHFYQRYLGVSIEAKFLTVRLRVALLWSSVMAKLMVFETSVSSKIVQVLPLFLDIVLSKRCFLLDSLLSLYMNNESKTFGEPLRSHWLVKGFQYNFLLLWFW